MKPTHSPQPFQNLQYIFNVILSIMICLAVSGIQPVSAAPPAAHYYVDRFDDYLINSGCDDVEDTNQCDLRGAILLAHSSAGSTSQVTIHLPAGTYTLTIPGEDDMNQEGDLDISGNHVILQGAGMYSTIIDGNDLDRVIDHSGSYTLGIKDLTIRNGYRSVGVGGGIRSINAGQLSLSNVRVSGNEVVSTLYNTYGGGIYLTDTSMVMSGSIIDNNRAVMGAGLAIYNTVDGTGVVIKDSTIYENRTTDSNGGGIWAGPHSNLNVENVTITENWADRLGNGGGIHFYNNTAARLNHVTIADNWAGGWEMPSPVSIRSTWMSTTAFFIMTLAVKFVTTRSGQLWISFRTVVISRMKAAVITANLVPSPELTHCLVSWDTIVQACRSFHYCPVARLLMRHWSQPLSSVPTSVASRVAMVMEMAQSIRMPVPLKSVRNSSFH